MRLVTIRCPQCAATVSVAQGADSVRCEYCGASSAVQRRTAFLQRPVQVPVRAELAALPVAVQKHSRAWVGAVLIVPLIMVATGGIVALKQSGAFGGRFIWGGGQAMPVDVNGDGVSDAIGLIRFVMSDDRTHLAAFDGKTGDKLWQSESLGKFADLTQSQVAAAAGAIAIASPLGTVEAFDASSGKRLWSGAALSEKPVRFCASEGRALIVHTADKQAKWIDLGDGSLSAVDYADSCQPPVTTIAGASPGTLLNKHPYGYHSEPSYVGDMSIDWTVRLRDGTFIAFGRKKEGTGVPMVASYRPEGEEYELLWSTVVPSGNPLAVDTGSPKASAVDEQAVLVAYESKDDLVRVAAFEIASGSRLWDVALPKPERGSEPVSGISVSGELVFVATWNRLHVLDVATGKSRFLVGGM